MHRKPRKAYRGDSYPRREARSDRRRFLLDLGLVSVSLTFGHRLQASDGGKPRTTALANGSYQLVLPPAPDLRELLLDSSQTLYYRITVIAATQEVATFVEQNYLALYGKLDAVLRPYTHGTLAVTQTRAEVEGRLLEALRTTRCAAVSCKTGDFISLALTTQDAVYDQTIGCTCGSVPWRPR